MAVGAKLEAATGRHAWSGLRTGHCQKLFDEGVYTCVSDIGDAEKIEKLREPDPRLALLAQDVVEGILDGRQTPNLEVGQLMQPFPVE